MTTIILLLKTVSIVVGFSSALINDLLTFRFLKDFKINKHENKTLQLLAGISLISALLLSLALILALWYEVPFINQDILMSSSIILAVVVANEIIFRRIIIFKLASYRTNFNFISIGKVIFLRRLALSLNIISIISWIYLLLIFQFGLTGKVFVSEILIGDYILISSVAVIILNVVYNLKSKV